MRGKLYRIIFKTDTPAGKLFDIVLLWSILLSVVLVALDSVQEIRQKYEFWIYWGEWAFTILFTIEFLLRLWTVKQHFRYLFSFFGIVDLLSILPTYITLFYPGGHYFLMIRVLRLLRVFRVLKLVQFTKEGQLLIRALKRSRPKIVIFLGAVISLTIIVGSLMYAIEGEENGFTSIPRSIYWAIVTLTTVGYGDIAPKTALGQFLAALVMLLGYGIIAVPTGIVSAEMAQIGQDKPGPKDALPAGSDLRCPECFSGGHDGDAHYCKYCGGRLARA